MCRLSESNITMMAFTANSFCESHPSNGNPAFYDEKSKPKMSSYVFGLGGREINPPLITQVYDELMKGKAKKENYLGVRDG